MPHLFLPFFIYLTLVLKFIRFFFLTVNFLHLLLKFFIVKPCNTFTLFPQSGSFDSVDVLIDTLTVLLPVLPLTSILTVISPSINAESMFFIVDILALVPSPVRPRENTLAMHIIVLPLPSVNFSIWPSISADA
jgi:hypothetical protein